LQEIPISISRWTLRHYLLIGLAAVVFAAVLKRMTAFWARSERARGLHKLWQT